MHWWLLARGIKDEFRFAVVFDIEGDCSFGSSPETDRASSAGGGHGGSASRWREGEFFAQSSRGQPNSQSATGGQPRYSGDHTRAGQASARVLLHRLELQRAG